jgi:hypothetical protein
MDIQIYINKGILFSVILGTILHFTYQISGKNKFVGYFSAINESIWEHIKLSVFPIIIYTLYTYFFEFDRNINNMFFALGIGVLLSLIIVPTLFYTYIKFTKTPVLPLDLLIFFIAVVVPFKVMQMIILLLELPVIFNVIGLIILLLVLGAFFLFTYNPPNNKIFKEVAY